MQEKLLERLQTLLGRNYRVNLSPVIPLFMKYPEVDICAYVTWLAETKGVTQLKSKIVNASNFEQYRLAQQLEKSSFPQHIVNVGELYMKLTSSKLSFDNVVEKLEDMCLKPAIYFMFASVGLNVDRYRKAAREYANKYPAAVLYLPEPFCTLGKALIHDST